MQEIWKDITGYEGLYKVSSYGRIKSLIDHYGNERVLILKNIVNDRGYLRVNLYKLGKIKTLKVHRIVAIEFIPNPDKKKQVNHIDGIKINNYISNLEWNTGHENIKHSWKIGLRKPLVFTDLHRQRIGIAKSKQVINYLNGEVYESIRQASLAYSISAPYLSRMLNGKCKNYTSLKYKTNF
jgi:hypothetical protein